MKRTLLTIAIIVSSCTASDWTRETLTAGGYSDIETQGYAMLACSEDDTFSTKFRARNPAGKMTTGVVCCGLLKSCTIRH